MAKATKKSTGKVKKGKPGRPETSAKKAAAKAPAKARRERMSTNQINKEDQALFLQHLPLVATAKAKLERANSELRKLYNTAKADGFIRDDFDTAFALQREGGETIRKNRIARDLTIARYLGIKLGDTLDLFLDQGVEEQTPEQRAFDAGKQDALGNNKPDAEGFNEQAYLKGYHSVSEKRLADMKKTEPAKPASPAVKSAADRAQERADKKKAQIQEEGPEREKATQQRQQDAQAFEPPTSGVALTRSQFAAQQAAGKSLEPEPTPEPDIPPSSSMFQRKEPPHAA